MGPRYLGRGANLWGFLGKTLTSDKERSASKFDCYASKTRVLTERNQTMSTVIQTTIAGRLDGQVTLITGAAGNIGLATAARFLQEGAKVALVDISPAGLEVALSTLTKSNLPQNVTVESHVLCIQADVTSSEGVQKYVDATVRAWGRLDTAFLCAGLSYNSTSIFDTTEETWDKVMNVNTRSGKLFAAF